MGAVPADGTRPLGREEGRPPAPCARASVRPGPSSTATCRAVPKRRSAACSTHRRRRRRCRRSCRDCGTGFVSAPDRGDRLQAYWMYRLFLDPDRLRETMTLFWHNHFATSNEKVRDEWLMLRQNDLLRSHALGELPAPAAGHPRGPRDARLARRRQQSQAAAEREPRPRVPRAVHARRRELHRSGRQSGGPCPDRLGREPGVARVPRGSASIPVNLTTGSRHSWAAPGAGGRRMSCG